METRQAEASTLISRISSELSRLTQVPIISYRARESEYNRNNVWKGRMSLPFFDLKGCSRFLQRGCIILKI